MNRVVRRAVLCCVCICLFSACSLAPVKTDVKYSRIARQHIYSLTYWEFSGRIALQNHENSWSANIEWVHEPEQDQLFLSGPFGQGAVRIILQPKSILIDYGDGRVESSEHVNEFIFRQLGFFVPALALRYWVLGLTAPDATHIDIDDGFSQFDWDVHYQHFIPINGELMPRKIKVIKGDEKLKLIIDHWVLNG